MKKIASSCYSCLPQAAVRSLMNFNRTGSGDGIIRKLPTALMTLYSRLMIPESRVMTTEDSCNREFRRSLQPTLIRRIMNSSLTFLSQSEQETDKLGHALAAVLTHGLPIALNGQLGSGKTRFVRALCSGLGVDTLSSTVRRSSLCSCIRTEESRSPISTPTGLVIWTSSFRSVLTSICCPTNGCV
jgi:hypothetical protein